MRVFLSYTRTKNEFKAVEKLRRHLENELDQLFPGSSVFQDVEVLQPGDRFAEELRKELDAADALLILLSPSWLASEWCRREYEYFCEAASKKAREPIVVPLLWTTTSQLLSRSDDALANELATLQHDDWRDLRHELWAESAEVGRRVARLAQALAGSTRQQEPVAAERLVSDAPSAPPPRVEHSELLPEALVGKAVAAVSEAMRRSAPSVALDEESIRRHLQHHLAQVSNWSDTIQIFGMSRYESTETATVAASIHTEPRRFRARHRKSSIVSEDSLLEDDRHYVLLGEPGAGKTTTLKRLARKLLRPRAKNRTDAYRFPIVLRLRELGAAPSLVTAIADTLGLKYRIETVDAVLHDPRFRDHPKQLFWVGDEHLEVVISALISQWHAVLLLDGLDEIEYESRRQREQDIISLAHAIHGGKIVATCRSGDYTQTLERFDVVEMAPLSAEQVTEIAGRWLTDAAEFEACLQRLPYRDVVDRPLLLVQLIVLFRRYGYLPEQPIYVYKRLIELLLEEWDAERDIRRLSKYAGFEPSRKAEFLAALAYHLTYETRTKNFDTAQLHAAYAALYERFRLPWQDAHRVVAEVQSHTGIVVQVGDDAYEFAHLSLQEYLCASHLVRDPLGEHIGKYAAVYAPPIAVAAALAGEPSRWLAVVILRSWILLNPESTRSLIARVLAERPAFTKSWLLGAAVMKLYVYFKAHSDIAALLDELVLSDSYVSESIVAALRHYSPLDTDTWGSTYRLNGEYPRDTHGVEIPKVVGLTTKIADRFARRTQQPR